MPLYRVFREMRSWKLVEAKSEEHALKRVKYATKAVPVVPTSEGVKLPPPKFKGRR